MFHSVNSIIWSTCWINYTHRNLKHISIFVKLRLQGDTNNYLPTYGVLVVQWHVTAAVVFCSPPLASCAAALQKFYSEDTGPCSTETRTHPKLMEWKQFNCKSTLSAMLERIQQGEAGQKHMVDCTRSKRHLLLCCSRLKSCIHVTRTQ